MIDQAAAAIRTIGRFRRFLNAAMNTASPAAAVATVRRPKYNSFGVRAPREEWGRCSLYHST